MVRSRSRSPRRRFSRSPRRYSRSRTKSPRRRNSRSFSRGRSRSPRHQSRSPPFERTGPQEFQQEKSQFQSQSSGFEEVSQDFIQSSCGFGNTEEIEEVSSPPEVESVSLDECIAGPTKVVVTLDDVEDGQILTPEENHPECVFLDAAEEPKKDVESGDEQICPTDEEVEVLLHSAALKDTSSHLPNKSTRQPRREPSITELTDRIANDFMRPETQALLQNILKLTSDDVSSIASRDGPPSPDPLIAEKILDEVDLEEVGEEVDDYFGSVAKELHLEESVKVATNPSPPKAPDKLSSLSKCQPTSRTPADYHTDWELKMALENPEKPLEKASDIPFRPPPIEKNRGKKSNSALWTPALDRRQVVEAKLKMMYQAGKSNWEVETPYIESPGHLRHQLRHCVDDGTTISSTLNAMTLMQIHCRK
ncbi:uncharacterized protein LOC135206146 isoform X1 [Macrobrachium nipponense]|uniref:uncharacterized protein LOC135206146 isoform X1 n=1 Tax=Macrobrachium nipponense TaxID=159736 RepID=UPI0030C8CA5A